MKPLIVCMTVLVVVGSTNAFAELKKADLSQRAPVTQGGALLNQVDILSLYFSSERVAHAARLVGNKRVDVESTVLDTRLAADRPELERFLTRQIETFVAVLAERLKTYAPSVAQTFDAKRDIRFLIKNGADRTLVAMWEGGVLRSATPEDSTIIQAERAVAAVPALSEVHAEAVAAKKACACPALRKK